MRSVFGEAWVTVSALLVAIGLLAESVPLVGLGVLVLGTGAVARLWARLSLEEVTYRRELGDRRAFAGEAITLRLELANGKLLPVPWIEVREQLPQSMPAEGGRTMASGMAGVVFLQRATALSGHDRVSWPLRLLAQERGYFRLGPTRLRSGDLFGLFEREATVGGDEAIVVYPRTVPLSDLGLTSARPFGELRGGSRIFEDPVRVIGVRDYQPGDPLKRVDWKATARSGQLQSRLYEPSRAQSLVVALNISTMEHTWQGFDPVLLERNIIVAASIARAAFDEHVAVGLVANGSFPDADRPIRIGSGRRPDQAVRVLEALAMITAFATSSLAEELERPGHALPAGATVVVVSSRMPPELAATLQRLRAQGHGVHVVKTGTMEWGSPLDQISVTDVEARMRELEAQFAAERAEAERASAPEGSLRRERGERAAARERAEAAGPPHVPPAVPPSVPPAGRGGAGR